MANAEREFNEFVQYRSGALLRTAYLLCAGDRAAAEDLLQDVLERMYLKWRRITGPPEAYARAALANAAANRWRLRSRRVAEAPLEAASQLGVAGPEDNVTNRDALLHALAELAPRMRAVLVLRFFDDLSEEQVAAALGCAIGTVKSQTFRALARMRELLAAQNDVEWEALARW